MPAWSPNGAKLAVAVALTSSTNIATMNTNGSGLITLATAVDFLVEDRVVAGRHEGHLHEERQWHPKRGVG